MMGGSSSRPKTALFSTRKERLEDYEVVLRRGSRPDYYQVILRKIRPGYLYLPQRRIPDYISSPTPRQEDTFISSSRSSSTKSSLASSTRIRTTVVGPKGSNKEPFFEAKCGNRDICSYIKSLSSDIIAVDASYIYENELEYVVICFNPETTKAAVMHNCPAFEHFILHFRHVSGEGKAVMDYILKEQRDFTEKDTIKIDKVIAENADYIMSRWKNISAITACPVQSFGYGTSNSKIVEAACIVILVDVKFPNKRIPVYQDQLPKKLDGVPVDIREGFVMPFGRPVTKEYHEKLRMGCEIGPGSINMSSTLGAFIDLPNNRVAGLTSLHAMYEWKDMRTYKNMTVRERQVFRNVKQPARSNNHIGSVSDIHFYEGRPGSQPGTCGMDIALIELSPERHPQDGEFPHCQLEESGHDAKVPISYTSGQVYNMAQLSKDTILIKYGAETLLTEGKLYRIGSVVAPVHPLVNPHQYRLCGQIEIQSCQIQSFSVEGSDEIRQESIPFAKPGDSGALVLAPFRGCMADIRAVGVLGGMISTGTFYVTPIQAILQKCGVKKLKSFPGK